MMNTVGEVNGMYKLNDYVTYRKNGVCQIIDITIQNFVGQGKREYYVLKSVYDENKKVFVPIGSDLEAEMQNVLSVEEIHKIIEDSRNVENMWVDDCRSRANIFDGIIESGDKAKMIWLIKTVADYKIEAEAQKKKMKATDTKYMAMAEGIVAGDFAFSLNLQKNQVMDYINEYLEK
ncbi:MAG: hypothetical protein E7593_06505 [Ruminococcaceae bacterium]|nr:hypothetical protein [Oscillospiraceae bacterium]